MRGLQQARASRGFVADPMNLLRFITGDSANIYATFIQAVGLWMFGLLLVILARSVNRDWFEHFARGFIFLALAISALRVAFALGPHYGRAFFFLYFLGEYLFLYFLIAGVRRLAGRAATGRGGSMARPRDFGPAGFSFGARFSPPGPLQQVARAAHGALRRIAGGHQRLQFSRRDHFHQLVDEHAESEVRRDPSG